MQIKKEILFTWQGHLFCVSLNSKNLLSIENVKKIEHNKFYQYFAESDLAKEMHKISSHDIYCSNLSLLKDFCKHSLEQNQESCFPAFFIYLSGGNLCAFLNIKIVFDMAEIDYICVHEFYKRQGISIELLHLFEDVCRKYSQTQITKILLEVGAKNYPALSLYEKFSFQEVSVRKKYYKNGEDAIIMEKTL